jgi:hypothetical protein
VKVPVQTEGLGSTHEGGVGVGVALDEGTTLEEGITLEETTSTEFEDTAAGLDDAAIELDTAMEEDDKIGMLDEGADGIEEELGTTKGTDEALLDERTGGLYVPPLHFPSPFWRVATSQ